MSRRKQGGTEVEIKVDRRFLLGFLGVLALVLALGLGILVGQLRDGGFTSTAAQPAPQGQLQQPLSPQQTGQQQVPQVQGEDAVPQVEPPQQAPAAGSGNLTEEDATGLSSSDVTRSPCYVINLLELQDNIVRADFRLTKAAGTEEPRPQLTVEGLNARCGNAYDFGHLDPTEVGQKNFTLKNVGDETLTVTGLYTSCGCTVAQVKGHEIDGYGVLSPPLLLEPGETKDFLVALDAKQVGDSQEPRIVQIFSDDPRGVPFGELWPAEGKDRELRFAILMQVGDSPGSSDAGPMDSSEH